LGLTQSVSATGAAVTGSVSDSAVDYTLSWTPILVSFGSNGLFEIAMNSLSFSDIGAKTQTATITLQQLPGVAAGTAVSEPSSVALLGLGLLGFVVARRKVADRK